MARIEYRSAPDERGRRSFTLYWTADFHPGDPRGENRTAERAQSFFANPAHVPAAQALTSEDR